MKPLAAFVALALAAFFFMFAPAVNQHVPFWPLMSATAAILSISSLIFQRKFFNDIYPLSTPDIFIGLFSALLLYAMFWAGHFLSTRILPFAASQIGSIYDIRSEQNPMLIACLLMFLIGPSEEIFWRGFVQHRLSKKFGRLTGLIIAAGLYTGVHIASLNFMLIAASALCGIFWGLLFMQTKKLWPCIISHAIWDVTIFILLPIT